MHQFILDHIELILAAMIALQGYVHFKLNAVYAWTRKIFVQIQLFMLASSAVHQEDEQRFKKLEEKLADKK